jgi:hypothetical protein
MAEPLQLLVVVGDIDADGRRLLDGLIRLVIDLLRERGIDARASVPRALDPLDDSEYALDKHRRSEFLLVPGRGPEGVYWDELIRRLRRSGYRRPISILRVSDRSAGLGETRIVEIDDRRIVSEAVGATVEIAEAAFRICEFIAADLSGEIAWNSTTEFAAARSLPSRLPDFLGADSERRDLRTRPQPQSLAALLARRAQAAVERFHIPESKGVIPDIIGTVRGSAEARSMANQAPLARLLLRYGSFLRQFFTDPHYIEFRDSEFRAFPVFSRKWLLLYASAAIAGAWLYRRELGDLMAPLLKLFGSMAPPIAAADPRAADPSETNDVELAAFAPAACGRGETILFQALLHLPADQPAAYALAVAADPAAVRKGTQTLSIALRNGERLDVDLEAEGCRIDEPRQTVTWRGKPLAVQFFATVSRRRKKPIPVQITAIRSGVPVGSVRFIIPIEAGAAKQPIELRGDEAKRFERAFVSYASEDRVSVLGYAQALNLTGIEIFQDVLSLDPGERWKRRLYSEIDHCDLFLLFWSRAASQSKWVVKEAKYALQSYNRSGSQRPAIRPYLLEGPPIPEIPASLKKSIHFNDKFRYLILGAKAEADARRHPRSLQ